MIEKIRLPLIIGFLFALVACSGGTKGELVLFDFESDAELDRFHWKCYTLFSLSDKYVSHGDRSLKLELYPSDYPGLTPMGGETDWRGYKSLRFDIYNPEHKEINLTVRIDDREDYPDYADRYNRSFNLKPGMNQLSIPINNLVTSGTHRNLDLGNIYRVFIFVVRPERKVVLYVDYMRLI
jgi:hypothetical protein